MSSSIPRAVLRPLVLLILLAAALTTTAARAGTIPARTCTGATAAIPGGFAAAGQWVVLENNSGERAPKYGTTTNFTGVPLCAVRSTGTATSGDPQWIFCTQASLYACGQDAMGGAALASDLDARARAEIAWAIATADLATAPGRAVAQTRVWCVTDRVQRGRSDADILADARAYFADHGVTLPAGTACPRWATVDAVLRAQPRLAVRGEAADAAGAGRFTVTTNLPEVRISATASVQPCADAPAGTTLDGGTLSVPGTSDARAVAVPLCTAPGTGAARIDVAAPGPLASDLTVIRSLRSPGTCQLMVTARGTRLAASATVTPAPAPVVAPAAAAPPTVVTAQSAPGSPRLTLAKRRVRRHGEPRRVRSGASVRWAITVRNRGTAAAKSVRVCDTLRRGLAVLSTAPRATPTSGRVCWRIATLRPGAHATLRITTRVSVTAPGCHVLANRASIPGGPSASSRVTVCRERRVRSGGTTG
jgi:uncharacterized repeat protein (TIGR01451 family)